MASTNLSTSSLLAIVLLLTLASANGHLRRQRKTQESVICRITVVETMLSVDGPHEEETSCIPIIEGSETDNMFPVELPPALYSDNSEAIGRGELFVSISGATLSDDLQVPDDATFQVLDSFPSHLRHLEERHLTATGTKTIAVVRISTTDATPMFSSYALQTGMFDDGINLKTQYSNCSFGQLQWVLAPAGVVNVRVNEPISNFNSGGALVTAAQKQLKVERGLSSVADLGDKVLMCLPPGTGNWAASAGVNHWRAQFNDEWCLSLTATVHELGHTLGLSHSNENGQPYGDSTGYMAAGHRQADWPQKCFNGHKNFKLGWFDSKTLSLNPVQEGSTLFKLATFVDYDATANDEPVLANIDDRYFLQYNRAKSFNIDTEEKKDQVTVTEGNTTGSSENLGGLSEGDTFQITNYQNSGMTLIVKVCDDVRSSDSNTPDIMVISVGMDQSVCGEPLTDVLTQPPATQAPTVPPTQPPATGSYQIKIQVKHDRWPEETAWTLIDTSSGRVIGSQRENTIITDYSLVEEQYTVAAGQYKFVMTDRYGDGICCGYGIGWFNVLVDGKSVASSNGEFSDSIEKVFGVGGQATIPPTSPPATTKVVKVEVKHDRWPEETAWELTRIDSGLVIGKQDEDEITADYFQAVKEYNVEPGSYKFRMTDRYGDGICCTYGTGWFKLSVDNVVVITDDGQFTGSTETTFVVS